MSEMNRVIKIGGSLLDVDNLEQAFYSWLAEQPKANNVIIVGGGGFVESLREVVDRFEIDEETAHWMAIDLMRLTSRLVSKILSGLEVVTDFKKLEEKLANRLQQRDGCCATVIFDPADFLRENEPTISSEPLPRCWEVTSDSIAARIAEIIKAEDLVLLKSANPPRFQTMDLVMESGYVDAHFSIAAKRIPLVRCVNMRSEPTQEWIIEQKKPTQRWSRL